jgi:mRNA interferase MazF
MIKDFDRWNRRKKRLDATTFDRYVHEREVWWCALGVNIGVEADGKHDNSERPVVVLYKFSRDAVLVVPLTSVAKPNPYYVSFSHDDRVFAAVFSQIRLISTKRLLRKIYRMDRRIFDEIKRLIMVLVERF